jgi:hypothetical protein
MDTQQQFELHFDDPQLPEEKQISIRGDRQQLTALHAAVTNYVQKMLGSSPEQFNPLLSAQTNVASETGVASTPQVPNTVVPEASKVESTDDVTATPAGEIFLQPASRLTHNLFLGVLATPKTGQFIQLRMMQLFDLSTVLDEYAADVLATPVLRSSRRVSTPSTAWASIAAMLLLAVGLTTAVVQLLNRSDQKPQTANRVVTPRANSNQQQIALKPSPTTPLSSPDALPSLPPVNTTNPSTTAGLPPGIPSPSATLPGTPLPIPQTTPAIPNLPTVPTTKTTPITQLPGITQTPPIANQPVPRQSEGSISIPRQAAVPETSRVTNLPGINSTTDIPSPPTQNRPLNEATRVTTPAGEQAMPKPTTHERLKAALEGRSSENPSERSPTSPGTANSPNAPQTTALVTTPQLNEVKEYFQKNWQPPTGLTQTLEYSIVLDVDGTIQRIEPLGKAARTYVDRSSLPLIGERFVSPSPSGDTPRIRIVLSPDGKIQTFLEPN